MNIPTQAHNNYNGSLETFLNGLTHPKPIITRKPKEYANRTTWKDALKQGIFYLEWYANKHHLLELRKQLHAPTYGQKLHQVKKYLLSNYNLQNHFESANLKDKELKEVASAPIEYRLIRGLLILIRCYEVENGFLSHKSKEWIFISELLEYESSKGYTHINEAFYKQFGYYYEDTDRIKKKLKEKRPQPTTPRKYYKRNEINKILNFLLYSLSHDHKAFTSTTDANGRTYNAFTNLAKVYRYNEYPFTLFEYDIKSANPQIIDILLKSEKWQNVYSNLMQSRKISREDAKRLFNATLNNYRLSIQKAKKVYLDAGYSSQEADALTKISAQSEKGEAFAIFTKIETELIQDFIEVHELRGNEYIRLHDAIFTESEIKSFEDRETKAEFNVSSKGTPILMLDFFKKSSSKKICLSTIPKTNLILWQNLTPKPKAFTYKNKEKGYSFTFYDEDIIISTATFNFNEEPKNDNEQAEYNKEFERTQFIEKLKRLYVMLNFQNFKVDIDSYFFECLEHIKLNSNYSFNINYVREVLLQDLKKLDKNEFKKHLAVRNWTYQGAMFYNEFTFIATLQEAKGKFTDFQNAKQLKNELENIVNGFKNDFLVHYIDKSEFKNCHHKKESIFFEIINKINAVLTISNSTKYKNMYTFASYYSNTLYSTSKKCTTIPKRTKKYLSILYENREVINEKITNALANFEILIEYGLHHLEDIEQIFIKDAFAYVTRPQDITINANNAFEGKADLQNSIFNHYTEADATRKGLLFFIEWYVFKNYTLQDLIPLDLISIKAEALKKYHENKSSHLDYIYLAKEE